jgi:hypothetical protein
LSDKLIDMIPNPADEERTPTGKLAKEIAIQAELLALNAALDCRGAGQASEALAALSRELLRATGPGMHVAARPPAGWRVERRTS